MILFCKACQTAHAIYDQIPQVCPSCQEYPARWTTMLTSSQPMAAYKLTLNDKKFLKDKHISPEE